MPTYLVILGIWNRLFVKERHKLAKDRVIPRRRRDGAILAGHPAFFRESRSTSTKDGSGGGAVE